MEHSYGESVMEMCVQLKICESCGCLWYRAQAELGRIDIYTFQLGFYLLKWKYVTYPL